MSRRVFVVGVGMTRFEKPGSRDWDYPDMGREAGTAALADAGVSYEQVEQVATSWVYGDSTAGQAACYELGLTGVPIYNVNNNCSSGSTALYLARQMISGGSADCVMALGFEKMERGSLGPKFPDRATPLDRHVALTSELFGWGSGPGSAQLFGNAGREHMARYGTTADQFAKIAEKNHLHSANNPNSQFRDVYTLDEVLSSPEVHSPLTKLQCCPTSDGGAAAILASEDFVRAHGLADQATEIAGLSLKTDTPDAFESRSAIKLVGTDMTRSASLDVYEQSGLGPEDVDVIELHDCFSVNELLTYEALGLCAEGAGGRLVDDGATTYGGAVVVNPSGGLISKGHPLGATGLAQCAELTWQLRGHAGDRQVPNAKVALQHNLGLGGAVVVALYRSVDPDTLS